MTPNLDSLKLEIQDFLEAEGFPIFHAYSRMMDSDGIVYWNCEEYPDYKMFVKTAKSAGALIMVYHHRQFAADQVNDALDRLETIEMPRDEARKLERRLKELRVYEGFTCAIELSFDLASRIYVFELRTDWYEELSELMDDLEMLGGDIEPEDEEPLGGYFSKN